MQADAADDQLPRGLRIESSNDHVEPSKIRAEIESVSTEIRRICEDLSPSALANVGLGAALEWALADAVGHQPLEKKFEYEFVCDAGVEGSVITKDDRNRVKLVPLQNAKPHPQFGSGKGLITMADDFDEPLKDLKSIPDEALARYAHLPVVLHRRLASTSSYL